MKCLRVKFWQWFHNLSLFIYVFGQFRNVMFACLKLCYQPYAECNIFIINVLQFFIMLYFHRRKMLKYGNKNSAIQTKKMI